MWWARDCFLSVQWLVCLHACHTRHVYPVWCLWTKRCGRNTFLSWQGFYRPSCHALPQLTLFPLGSMCVHSNINNYTHSQHRRTSTKDKETETWNKSSLNHTHTQTHIFFYTERRDGSGQRERLRERGKQKIVQKKTNYTQTEKVREKKKKIQAK